jgi:hypothetical protein
VHRQHDAHGQACDGDQRHRADAELKQLAKRFADLEWRAEGLANGTSCEERHLAASSGCHRE